MTVPRLVLDSEKPYVGAFLMGPNRTRVRKVHVHVLGFVILWFQLDLLSNHRLLPLSAGLIVLAAAKRPRAPGVKDPMIHN